MPMVRPDHAISRGGSRRWMVEVTVLGPAFQRKVDPTTTGSCTDMALTSGFQIGQRSNAVSTSHTTSGGAAISISVRLTTGARVSINSVIRSPGLWRPHNDVAVSSHIARV